MISCRSMYRSVKSSKWWGECRMLTEVGGKFICDKFGGE